MDPLQTVVRNMASIVSATDKNNVGRKLLKLWDDQAPKIGDYINELPQPQELERVRISAALKEPALRQAMESMGFDLDDIPEDALAAAIDLIPDGFLTQKSNVLPANTIRIKDGDAVRYLQLKPELYKAITSLDADQVSLAVKWGGAMADILRAGATKFNPFFAAKNVVRDSATAALVSRVGSVPLANSVRGLGILLGNTEFEGAFSKALRWALEGKGEALADNVLALEKKAVEPFQRGLQRLTKSNPNDIKEFNRVGARQGVDDMLRSETGLRKVQREVYGSLSPQQRQLVMIPPSVRLVAGKAKDVALSPLKAVGMLSELSEGSTRLGEFAKAKEVLRKAHPDWSDYDIALRALRKMRERAARVTPPPGGKP